MKNIRLTILFIFFQTLVSAQLRLPGIFGDSMVLQRGMAIPIWGWADKGEKITVQFNRQKKNTITADDGKWKLQLDAETAGGPFQLTVSGKTKLVFQNLLVGDVWVCSGQSNMEFAVSGVNNAAKEIQLSANPLIRHIIIPKAVSGEPKEDLANKSSWKAASPANTGSFTAVGYFFAKEINQALNIPIGLIHSSWGGTHSETWTSKEAFEKSPEFSYLTSNLPRLSLDSIAIIRKKTMVEKLKKLQGGLPLTGSVPMWKMAGFDDSGWPKMNAPKLWEEQSLGDFDGVVWYRKTFTLSAEEAGKPAVLHLGMIDDNDETYLNGVKLGTTRAYNVKREYPIAAGILQKGNNTLAVRVEDTGGGGGFYSEEGWMKLLLPDQVVPLAGEWAFQVESAIAPSASFNPNAYPSLLFNAMLYPLINFGIKGAIWYQGESNAGRAFQYRTAFPLMIKDWRWHWKQGNFPFYFVQLAGFNSANGNSLKGSTWAELREAQTLTLSLPNTGMAVTTDIGESNDIHPKNKQDVGKRLAWVALNKTYGIKKEYSGPVFLSMQVSGNEVEISFSHIGKGLSANNPSHTVMGFEVAGSDRIFHPANAIIQGEKVILSAAAVIKPVAVRYAWADDTGAASLINKDGLPAPPFRTDQWNTITQKEKFKVSL